jgi:hypothetical protein
MQGVEIVEHLLNGADEQTVWQPDFVNQGGAKHRSTDPESVAS